MNLKKINAKDLIFSGEIEDDRTNTYVTLNDYDWMNYLIQTRFKTEEQGILNVTFEYFGATSSQMKVSQIKDGEKKEYIYNFPTDIYKKHIVKFLQAHIAAWDDTYAFNGEDYVIDFFNEVLEKGQENIVEKPRPGDLVMGKFNYSDM